MAKVGIKHQSINQSINQSIYFDLIKNCISHLCFHWDPVIKKLHVLKYKPHSCRLVIV